MSDEDFVNNIKNIIDVKKFFIIHPVINIDETIDKLLLSNFSLKRYIDGKFEAVHVFI